MAEERDVTINKMLAENRIYGFTKGWTPQYPELRNANPPQQKVLDAWLNPQFRNFILPWPNRVGKTELEPIIAFSVMFGEWPWNGEKIVFPHNKPRKVRVVGQGWESHVETVVMPKLNDWWPKARKVLKSKNNQGIDASWIDTKTKSSLEVMSTVQKSSTFEGWEGDLVIFDEPPPREIWVACSRGLIDRNGRALIGATLIKEAWIYRDLIKRRNPDGSPDLSVFTCNAVIYDNVSKCKLCNEMILRIEQEGGKQYGVCPTHGRQWDYLKYGLTLDGVKEFIKDLDPQEIEARIFGKPFNLQTLVFPKFDRQSHVKERFKMPLDALIDIQIDFHPSKKWAVVFLATTKNGFKYVCDEIYDKGNPKYICEEIIRRITERNYMRINSIGIDPLAKGGEDNEIDVFSIMSGVFMAHNYSLETGSKDKDVGIAIINNLLWTENDMPGLFFFSDCGMTIKQTENLMYDQESLKQIAVKVDDDFTECLYRTVLKNTEWYPEYDHKSISKATVVL
jgi:hypothetical protein